MQKNTGEKFIKKDEAQEILEMFKNGHIKPTLGGRSKARVYKKQKSITLSKEVWEKLTELTNNPNKFIDFWLAQLFGLSYEKCYGRKAIKHGKNQIMWDYIGFHKTVEIKKE